LLAVTNSIGKKEVLLVACIVGFTQTVKRKPLVDLRNLTFTYCSLK